MTPDAARSVGPSRAARTRARLALVAAAVALLTLRGSAAAPPPLRPAATPPPPPARRGIFEVVPPDDPKALEKILNHLGDRARAYEAIALKFVCIESIRKADEPDKEKRYDYMYTEAEVRRYRPYRQKHTGKPGRGEEEPEEILDLHFPDSYSWTLMFARDRQHIFKFSYAGQEWFSLRLAHILEFTAPLPFTSGRTIYEWSGRVWVDAETYNFLKVEAVPGNQKDRLALALREYRRATRLLGIPLARRPVGAGYNITFLNEYEKLSLPDQAEFRQFVLDLSGNEEFLALWLLRYRGYQFFGVDVKDIMLR